MVLASSCHTAADSVGEGGFGSRGNDVDGCGHLTPEFSCERMNKSEREALAIPSSFVSCNDR